jgi:hypothetical protein
MEATGAPTVTDGEQRASSFATYPFMDTLAGTGLSENLALVGQYFAIFNDGHDRQLPRLTGEPSQYKTDIVYFIGQPNESLKPADSDENIWSLAG